jgi:hypothetical protein
VVYQQIESAAPQDVEAGCFCLPFDCGKVRGYGLDKSAFLKIVDVTASLSRMEDETESGP